MKSLWKKIIPEKNESVPVCSIINFCTHDYRFLQSCLREAAVFSSQVLVAYSDHLFDGMPENLPLLRRAMAEHPEVEFVLLAYQSEEKQNPQYWVTMLRWNALQKVRTEIKYVLFLDADEIAEGKRFHSFLQNFPVSRFTILKLSNYYYFRESRFRSRVQEDSATLVKKDLLTREMLVDYEDRNKAWLVLPEPKQRMVAGMDQKPLIHHFSWVRTREEMLRKVSSWGHAGERNWVEMVENEFSKPFSGIDFVHGYEYDEVEAPFPEIGL